MDAFFTNSTFRACQPPDGLCYTPTAQDAYVQAPVIQVAPRVSGTVTELAVKDNQEVKPGTPLFQIDKRSYQ
jgi:multidrug resistance efflux pump